MKWLQLIHNFTEDKTGLKKDDLKLECSYFSLFLIEAQIEALSLESWSLLDCLLSPFDTTLVTFDHSFFAIYMKKIPGLSCTFPVLP